MADKDKKNEKKINKEKADPGVGKDTGDKSLNSKEKTDAKNQKKSAKKKEPELKLQGVSGKLITGVVQVIKRGKPADRPAENKSEEKSVNAEKAAETTAAKKPDEISQSKAASGAKVTEHTAESQKSVKSEARAENKQSEEIASKQEADKKAPASSSAKTFKSRKEELKEVKSPVQLSKSAENKKAADKKPNAEKISKTKENAAEEKPAVIRDTPPEPIFQGTPIRKEKSKAEVIQEIKEAEKKKDTDNKSKKDFAKVSKTDKDTVSRDQDQNESVAKNKEGKSKRQAAGPKAKKSKGRVLVDQGVTESAYTGKRVIRAQRGDYVGEDADTAAFEKRRDNRRRSSDRFSGNDFRRASDERASNRDDSRGYRRGGKRRNDFVPPAPPTGDDFRGKQESRKAYNQKHSRDRNRRSNDIFHDMGREEREFAMGLLNRNKPKPKKKKHNVKPAKQETVIIYKGITVKEFAKAISRPLGEVVTTMMDLGIAAEINNRLDFDSYQMAGEILGVKIEADTSDDLEQLYKDPKDDPEDLERRAPVVCVMGHVDHGKTSLLDYIRNAQVTEDEAGGITQSLGAYTARIGDKKITFIDTPGHESFTTMRARGAQVTDIAILVIAADDGIKPQTIEAINHAMEAKTKVVIAINKIDKIGGGEAEVQAVIRKVQAGLSELMPDYDVYTGMTIQPVSAKTGQGIDELLELLLLEAEMLELKANPDRNAMGTVLESRLSRNQGPVASVLVQKGTLKKGDFIAAGSAYGKVKVLTNDRGKRVNSAGPSEPIQVIGLSAVPEAGQTLIEFDKQAKAKEYAEKFAEQLREKEMMTEGVTLANLAETLRKAEQKELKLVLKADTAGSIEALRKDLTGLGNDEVSVKIIHAAVGGVSENDVTLAKNAKAIVIGFNVNATPEVRKTAHSMGVEINLYDVIYDANDAVEAALKGMLSPVIKEVIYGTAEVLKIFKSSSVGTIGGCMVTDGKIVRNGGIRLIRDGKVVYIGEPQALKRMQDDVKEVNKGYECGLSIKNYNDIKVGDIIESFGEVEEEAEL